MLMCYQSSHLISLWLPCQAVTLSSGMHFIKFLAQVTIVCFFSILTTISPMHPIKQMQVQPQAEQTCHHPFRGAPMTAPKGPAIVGCESMQT